MLTRPVSRFRTEPKRGNYGRSPLFVPLVYAASDDWLPKHVVLDVENDAAWLPNNQERHYKTAETAILELAEKQTNTNRQGRQMASDFASALERLGNDPSLFREFISYYEDDCPQLVEAIRHAVARRDAAAVHRASHALRGLAANLGGIDVAAVALAIEECSMRGDLSDIVAMMERLDAALSSLNAELHECKCAF